MNHYLITLNSATGLIECEEFSVSPFAAICKMLRSIHQLPNGMFRLTCKAIA